AYNFCLSDGERGPRPFCSHFNVGATLRRGPFAQMTVQLFVPTFGCLLRNTEDRRETRDIRSLKIRKVRFARIDSERFQERQPFARRQAVKLLKPSMPCTLPPLRHINLIEQVDARDRLLKPPPECS